MKYTYISVTVEENEKCYAYALKVSSNDNLLKKLSIKGIINATICDTKKAADELVKTWNDSLKNRGLYMFDEPLF